MRSEVPNSKFLIMPLSEQEYKKKKLAETFETLAIVLFRGKIVLLAYPARDGRCVIPYSFHFTTENINGPAAFFSASLLGLSHHLMRNFLIFSRSRRH